SSAHSEFPEAFAFLTQLPRVAYPILPLNAAIAVFPPPAIWTRQTKKPTPTGTRTMSILRPIAWLTAVLAALPMAATACADHSLPDHQLQPFVDPHYFDTDFQFFAPAEVDDFGGEERARTGLYVAFDRTYVNVSRPVNQFDFGSGNQGD